MNSESNVFNPLDLQLSRSTFHYSPTYSGACCAGTLIPTLAFEVLPGDSIKMDLNTLIKMATPRYPVMDNLYLDVSFFFVPNKLVLGRRYGTPTLNDGNTSWKAIIGAQDNLLNMPIPAQGVKLPWVKTTYAHSYGSLQDHMGVPTLFKDLTSNPDMFGHSDTKLNALPYLSYFAVWNENYRDPNTMEPVTWTIASNGQLSPQGHVAVCCPTKVAVAVKSNSSLTGNYCVVNALGQGDISTSASVDSILWMPFNTCRFHGYLGSALPWPQRNIDGVELPLGDKAPVFAGAEHLDYGVDDTVSLILREVDSDGLSGSHLPPSVTLVDSGNSDGSVGFSNTTQTPASGLTVTPSNLWTDLSQATAANVNMLRAAIQRQRWFERLSVSGNRYEEVKYGLFGCRGMDALSDRPLYLGGKRIPLRIDMVASTNGASSGKIGALGAFSHTNDAGNYFYHSFDDWGTMLCVFTIRAHTTAVNALKRSFVRQTRDDYYFPTFAHLGEQQVSLPETGVAHAGAFGYQQAWEEYRFEPDVLTGPLKPGRGLAYMTFAEDFEMLFGSSMTLADYLNASYQVQAIDQTLDVPSTATSEGFQFIYQFNFDFTCRRALPTYSVPGLMDHF